jgi:peptidyl-tRNA hydrolase, PTH1 family
MKLIVGLGNPGQKYESTRHNMGFMSVDHFLKDFKNVQSPSWIEEIRFKSDISQIEWQPKTGKAEKVVLVKPKTYMNLSGLAVSLIANYYKVQSTDIWVVHDDLDLPLGTMKIRLGGASAGHHGVESIIDALGTDKFWRFRLGTGESHSKVKIAKHMIRKADEFVLSGFQGGESKKARELVKRASKALQAALEDGIEKAQNRFNTK